QFRNRRLFFHSHPPHLLDLRFVEFRAWIRCTLFEHQPCDQCVPLVFGAGHDFKVRDRVVTFVSIFMIDLHLWGNLPNPTECNKTMDEKMRWTPVSVKVDMPVTGFDFKLSQSLDAALETLYDARARNFVTGKPWDTGLCVVFHRSSYRKIH